MRREKTYEREKEEFRERVWRDGEIDIMDH
jgi:hypothetical protein